MIIEKLYYILSGTVMALFDLLPSVPAVPEAVSSGGDWVINAISSASGLLTALFTAPLLAAAVFIMIGILTFEQVYHTVLWVAKKIPFLSIK